MPPTLIQLRPSTWQMRYSFFFAGRPQPGVGGGDRHAAQAGDPLDGGVDQSLQGVAVDPCLFAVVLFLGGGAGKQVAEDSTGEYHAFGPLVGYRQRMCRSSAAAALSKTTNWPLRGWMAKLAAPSRRCSSWSPKSPAQLITWRARRSPRRVCNSHSPPSKAPSSTSTLKQASAPWACACCR